MRSFLIASAALLIVGSVPAAAAPDYPWCQRTRNTGGTPQCSFTSFQQCQATISGVGGTCVQNPRLAYGQYRGPRGAQHDGWQGDTWGSGRW